MIEKWGTMHNLPPETATAARFPLSDRVLALDVGGANIKAADGRGRVHCEAFPLWQRWRELPTRLAGIVEEWQPQRIVATMTGEITDCYADRAAGVAAIVSALEVAAAMVTPAADLAIYLVDGRLVPAGVALEHPLEAAASNWHALARLAASSAGVERGLLIDVGSTTTDILAIDARGPVPLAKDDAGRMLSGELVYTGIDRTPVAAIVRSLPLAGRLRPVATELYARSQDVWLLLGGLPEDPGSTDTADGRAATREAARVRLARMFLVEPASVTLAAATFAAEACAEAQGLRVARAIDRVLGRHRWRPQRVVVSGHGTCLAELALARLGWFGTVIRLEKEIGPELSRAAPAHALALIARGELP